MTEEEYKESLSVFRKQAQATEQVVRIYASHGRINLDTLLEKVGEAIEARAKAEERQVEYREAYPVIECDPPEKEVVVTSFRQADVSGRLGH